jgi:hypothetical protein
MSDNARYDITTLNVLSLAVLAFAVEEAINAREVRITSANPSAFLVRIVSIPAYSKGRSLQTTHFSSRYNSPSFNNATSCSLARVASDRSVDVPSEMRSAHSEQ